ncbi:hypothetical protein [Bacillus dakarensis]|uniref:hypothetical protein n=1 Tax=Robertmurraya dakarensis TaxID=1926278 RepID=UPI0011155BF6|nr:hypothetical protein [Bacillus dakarensis]
MVNILLAGGIFTGNVQAQVLVISRTGENNLFDIPPSGSIAFQIEDSASISIINVSDAVVSGEMTIVKDFCICCP